MEEPGVETTSEDIEVGAADDTLQLWRTQQAIRHGELRLSIQATNRSGLETRATSIIGWATTASLACVGLAITPATQWVAWPASGAFLLLVVAAGLSFAALWPTEQWCVGGYPPDDLLDSTDRSELEILEQIARDYGGGIRSNKAQLERMALLLRVSWASLALAPVMAVVIVLIRSPY